MEKDWFEALRIMEFARYLNKRRGENRLRMLDGPYNYTHLHARKYPTLDGSRYFWEARFLTCTIDASPKCLEDIDRFIKTDGCVLRYFTIKTKATVDLVTNPSFRNPYLEPPIQKVKPF